MFTTTFDSVSQAYLKGYRYIVSKGGTRSGKTYSELQLLDIILSKPKQRVITTVSHSLPHLIGGAIRDYDTILQDRGIIPDDIRTKNPYIYKHNQSIHEFIGFDSPGKAIGATRDILFINEANKMEWAVCHQLMQRTKECVFIDFNPSTQFWIDELTGRPDCIVINSTFLDNYDNLTEGQIEDFKEAKRKADAEKSRGIYGYWSNWWRVYGLGEYGQVEGAIFTDWEIGNFDSSLPYRFGLDFGFSNDPDALVKIAVDEKRKIIYLHECFYKNGQSFDTLSENLKFYVGRNEHIIADVSEDRLIFDLSKRFNISKCVRIRVTERIKKMQGYHMIITPDSVNLQNELINYIWSDKKSGTPIDKSNHLLDAAGYGFISGQPQTKSKLYL